MKCFANRRADGERRARDARARVAQSQPLSPLPPLLVYIARDGAMRIYLSLRHASPQSVPESHVAHHACCANHADRANFLALQVHQAVLRLCDHVSRYGAPLGRYSPYPQALRNCYADHLARPFPHSYHQRCVPTLGANAVAAW
jgi:hypothetical protein